MEEIVMVAQSLAEREFRAGELAALSVLCEEARRQWEARLREEVQVEDCRGIFTLACAWTALAALEETAEAGLPRSFTAGELRVDRGSDSAAGARSLRRQAELLMAPYVEDERFAFLEVMG